MTRHLQPLPNFSLGLMRSMKVLGCLSLVIMAFHAAWKWGGAGGTAYAGTVGTLGPAFFIALLLWPMWLTSCICVPTILFRRQPTSASKALALLFVPLLAYGIYFLIVGGSGERAGIR